LLRHENIFKAHRSHLYQRLQQSGLSHERVAILYISINGLIAACIAYFDAIGALISLICMILALICGEIYLQSLQRKLTKNN
jgi:ABC-type polysaccharide transport system permease subunit